EKRKKRGRSCPVRGFYPLYQVDHHGWACEPAPGDTRIASPLLPRSQRRASGCRLGTLAQVPGGGLSCPFPVLPPRPHQDFIVFRASVRLNERARTQSFPLPVISCRSAKRTG